MGRTEGVVLSVPEEDGLGKVGEGKRYGGRRERQQDGCFMADVIPK